MGAPRGRPRGLIRQDQAVAGEKGVDSNGGLDPLLSAARVAHERPPNLLLGAPSFRAEGKKGCPPGQFPVGGTPIPSAKHIPLA